MRKRLAVLLTLLLALTAPALAGLISQEQEIAIGREGAARLESQYRIVTDLAYQERITRIGQALASHGKRGLAYQFKVIDESGINALAFPGGFIYATRGLMDAMPDDQLAFVLGHEVSHVEDRHSVQEMEANVYKEVGLGMLLSLLGGDNVGQGTLNTVEIASLVVSSQYSQEAEREADRHGMRLMAVAGWDPRAAIAALETLQRHNGEEMPGFLNSLVSSHPLTSERIEAARKLAPEIPYAPRTPDPQPQTQTQTHTAPTSPAPVFTPIP